MIGIEYLLLDCGIDINRLTAYNPIGIIPMTRRLLFIISNENERIRTKRAIPPLNDKAHNIGLLEIYSTESSIV